jgi:predicted transcriptional regulator
MENKEYVSVKEFAELVGITPQGVYKQLNNKLKDRFIRDGKKIKIEKSASELFENKDSSTVEQQFNNQLINELINQLKAKDEQIAHFQKLLDQEQQLRMVAEKKVLQIEEKPRKWWQRKGAKERA